MNVLVYLGASLGNKEIFKEATIELANWICDNNHRMIYGGNFKGLMGVLANRVIERGCEVVGVMPTFFVSEDNNRNKLTKFIEVNTMQERKDKFRELADICIALPGGPGTMEEITEAISLYRVKQSNLPCVILNVDGYYDNMKKMYDNVLESGFMTETERNSILFTNNLNDIECFYKREKGLL